MRAILFSYEGADYYFAFTNSAYLKSCELWPDSQNTLEIIDDAKPDSLKNICKMALLLSEAGELARRYLGYDEGPMLQEEQMEDLLHIGARGDVMRLKMAVMQAIMLGFKREVQEPEEREVDLGLIELQRQKKRI